MMVNYTLTDIDQIAHKIVNSLDYSTLLFEGEVGAGKTTLIKALCKQWNIEDLVTSPTFSIVNEYRTKEKSIFHFDFYRMKKSEEALDIGFSDYLDQNAIILIEWPHLVTNFLPKHYHTIKLSKKKNLERELKFS